MRSVIEIQRDIDQHAAVLSALRLEMATILPRQIPPWIHPSLTPTVTFSYEPTPWRPAGDP